MQQNDGADEKAPNQHLAAGSARVRSKVLPGRAKSIEHDSEKDGNDQVKAVQEDQLGIFGQILYLGIVRREVTAAGHPADMRPPEAAEAGRMNVFVVVGMLMMMTMDGGPPQSAALHGGVAQSGEEELRQAGGVKSAMRKVAMIKASHREHAHKIKSQRGPKRNFAPANPKNAQTTEMQEKERETAAKVEVIRFLADHLRALGKVIGIKPLPKGDEHLSGEAFRLAG